MLGLQGEEQWCKYSSCQSLSQQGWTQGGDYYAGGQWQINFF